MKQALMGLLLVTGFTALPALAQQETDTPAAKWFNWRNRPPASQASATPAPDQKLQWYAQQTRLYPNQAALHYQYGLMLAEAEDDAGAVRAFQRTLEIQPGLRQALYQLAKAEFRQAHAAEAVKLLEKLLQSWVVDPDSYELLGLSYQQLGQLPAARKAYVQALRLNPEHPAREYFETLTPGYHEHGEHSPGPALSAAELDFSSVQQALATLKEQARKQPKAAADLLPKLKALVSTRPDYHPAFAELALQLENSGKFAEAANWREQLYLLNACEGDNPGKLGRYLLWAGYLERASELLEQQQSCQPNAEAAYWLGQLYRQRGENELASRHYQQALKRWPKDTRLLAAQAAYYLSQGRYNEARGSLTQLANLKAMGPEALYVRSQLYLNTGQPQAAIQDLKAALAAQKRPEYSKALALAYLQAGMAEPARQELERYLQLRPAERQDLSEVFARIKALPQKGRFSNKPPVAAGRKW